MVESERTLTIAAMIARYTSQGFAVIDTSSLKVRPDRLIHKTVAGAKSALAGRILSHLIDPVTCSGAWHVQENELPKYP